MGVVGSVAVQAGDEEDGGDRVLQASGLRGAGVHWNGWPIGARGSHVWDEFFVDGIGPSADSSHVSGLLHLPGFPLYSGVHDGKARNAVEASDAEVEEGG